MTQNKTTSNYCSKEFLGECDHIKRLQAQLAEAELARKVAQSTVQFEANANHKLVEEKKRALETLKGTSLPKELHQKLNEVAYSLAQCDINMLDRIAVACKYGDILKPFLVGVIAAERNRIRLKLTGGGLFGSGEEMKTTIEIVDEYTKLKERYLQCVSWAIPFKDTEANAKMNRAEQELIAFKKKNWEEKNKP